MKSIFIASANHPTEPLPTLVEEMNSIDASLRYGVLKQFFSLHTDAHVTREKLVKDLVDFQDSIIHFHYCGHAERDSLISEGEITAAEGVAALLGKCKNLKLVVLNGCSTKGQVEALIQNGVPVVIATSTPIDDFQASEFARVFYQVLGSAGTIEKAFDDAMAAVKTIASDYNWGEADKKQVDRSFGFKDPNPTKTPAWGMYYHDENAIQVGLPMEKKPISLDGYTPNDKLIEELLEAFAPYDTAIKKIVEQEEEGDEVSIVKKRKAILQILPHPVSQQLRKLLVPESGDYDGKFFDKVGFDRLQQIERTYTTLIELMTFALMAQLWESAEVKENFKFTEEDLSFIKSFLYNNKKERKTYNFFPLMASIRQIFEKQEEEVSFFISEFKGISEIFNQHGNFYIACQYLENIKKYVVENVKNPNEEEAAAYCIEAEDQLGDVFKYLGFLANYTIVSVTQIDLVKYRHQKEPKFKHHMVKLVQEFVGLETEVETFDKFMDSSSVLLFNKKNEESRKFLNLSPFVIDENAFDDKADLAKLQYFEVYSKANDYCLYKHVYKPDDASFDTSKKKKYKVIKLQLDAFSKKLFNRPMNQL